jgi:HK97 gp10 family phage protein
MAVQRSRITGAREMDRLLKRLPREIGQRDLAAAVRAGAQIWRKAAIANLEGGGKDDVIVRKARKRQSRFSVTMLIGPPKEKFFLMFKEFGTARHGITPKNKAVLADEAAGEFFGAEVDHPGQQARPFLRPAVDVNVAPARDKIGQVLFRRLSRSATKLASGIRRRRGRGRGGRR